MFKNNKVTMTAAVLMMVACGGKDGGDTSEDTGPANKATEEKAASESSTNNNESAPGSVGSSVNNSTSTASPRFQGGARGFFIGHSALNDIVADHVATQVRLDGSGSTLQISEATTEHISLMGKRDVPLVRSVFDKEDTTYDFAVITEAWDYQNYNPELHGVDGGAVVGCPETPSAPSDWIDNTNEWAPIPYYIQSYRDAFVCANSDTKVFYYQTWSLGYNEVTNGATRASDPAYVKPSEEIVGSDIASNITPDLPLADRIIYEGVKWERLLKATNRPDIEFIPAAYGLAELMKEIEAGTTPGFEALAATGGVDGSGKLAWADYLFYEDQYHLSSVGHYFMSLMIYAKVYNKSPEGIQFTEADFPTSEAFSNNQYPLRAISDAEFQQLLTESGASGVYDLRGYLGYDYLPDSLRTHLQQMAWEVVNSL